MKIFLKPLLLILASFFLLDLLFLNWQTLKIIQSPQLKSGEFQVAIPTPASSPVETSVSCPQVCLDIISEASLSSGKPLSTPTPRANPTNPVKEFYVPLGTGSTTATSWTDIPGAEAYINPGNYGKIKNVTFEASLRVPSGAGRVYARLYNVNEKLGIFESEVSAEAQSGVRIESAKINLPLGNVLYRVQLKTTMGQEGFLDGGRVKIITE